MENISCDDSSVVDTIANMFGDVITREVICTVVESCEGDLDLSVEAIMNITSDTKNVSQKEDKVETPIQTHSTDIPPSSNSDHTARLINSTSNMVTSPVTSYASASQSKGAIPKQIAKPKIVANKPIFWTEQIRQIMTYHNQGARILIILRGAPGSGKTYLAEQIVQMTIGSTYDDFKKHIFSTDDFFMKNGQYQYEKFKLTEAHTWNRLRVKQELSNGLSPVILDNTNIELWEMEFYIREGVCNGYYIEIVEPKTQWARKPNQLYKRNVHNVPLPTIKRMLDNYQNHISGLYLIQGFGLSYPGNMVPPVLRKYPPMLNEETTQSEDLSDISQTEDQKKNKEITLQNESSTVSQKEYSALLQVHTAGTIERLTEAVPESEYLENNAYVLEQNVEKEQDIKEPEVLDTNTQENSLEELSHEEIIKLNKVLEAQKRLDEIEQVEAEWENGESWEDDSNKLDMACSKTTPILSTESKPPRHQDAAKCDISANIMDSVNKCDDWSQISMFMPSWNDTPHPSTFGNDVMKEYAYVEKIASSTCIEIGDTDVINNKNNYKVISATPKDINLFHVSSNNEKIPDKRKLDKSTLTYEHTIAEANRCKNEEHHFKTFRKMFKNVGRADLRDIFDKCRGDVNWAVDIVLDSMTNKLLDMVEDQDLSDVEEAIIEQCDCLAAYNIIPDVASSTSQNIVTDDVQEIAISRPQVLRKLKKDVVLSETSMELKRQIEKNVNISENHYSPHCLKLKKIRHGETVNTGKSSEQLSNPEGQNMALPVGSSAATTASLDNSDDDEEANSECIEEPTKVVNVNVGMEFISMLDEMFGRKDMVYPNNVTPTLTISVSTLNELNASWMESLMNQIENESKQIQEMIKQDEEFARELALKEEELLIAGKEPAVPDFKEIMDMDLALSLYQKDLAEWRNSEPQDLAGKMTRDKLYNLFPEVTQDVLAELLVAHHNNFQATVESLLISTGRQDILDQENGLNKFVMEKEIERQKKILEQEKALSEEDFPLLPRGEVATMATVNEYRHKAEKHLLRRNLHYQRAQEFIHRGMTQVANHYSNIAAYHKQHYEQANSWAAAALMQVHAQNHRDSATIDLHYMRVGEARESLDLFLDMHIRKLQENPNRGPRYMNLFFITGRGLHSHGQPRIKPAVKKRLRERGLTFSERNPGLLTAKVCADNKLSYQLSNE